LLDLGINEYWFYPSWKHYPPDVDYAVFDFSQGVTAVDVIAPFVWPEGTGSASGILMHAALLDEQLTAIQGVMDTVVFGYGP